MVFEPFNGERHVSVTDRRTKVDWAKCVKDIVDDHYPDAAKITLIMDNLNTHKPSSLYEAFLPEEARRLLNKLEFHYTPKHGSWLNMAEIEFSALKRQCLDCRIPDQATLKQKIADWERSRNQRAVKANWQFKTGDARIKLKKLYPSFGSSRIHVESNAEVHHFRTHSFLTGYQVQDTARWESKIQ